MDKESIDRAISTFSLIQISRAARNVELRSSAKVMPGVRREDRSSGGAGRQLWGVLVAEDHRELEGDANRNGSGAHGHGAYDDSTEEAAELEFQRDRQRGRQVSWESAVSGGK